MSEPENGWIEVDANFKERMTRPDLNFNDPFQHMAISVTYATFGLDLAETRNMTTARRQIGVCKRQIIAAQKRHRYLYMSAAACLAVGAIKSAIKWQHHAAAEYRLIENRRERIERLRNG